MSRAIFRKMGREAPPWQEGRNRGTQAVEGAEEVVEFYGDGYAIHIHRKLPNTHRTFDVVSGNASRLPPASVGLGLPPEGVHEVVDPPFAMDNPAS